MSPVPRARISSRRCSQPRLARSVRRLDQADPFGETHTPTGSSGRCAVSDSYDIATSNVSIQFGAKPLFEQVTVKFADGNRYGLIGLTAAASHADESTGGELEPSSGDVLMLQAALRLGKLNQNQFAYEDRAGS